MAGTIPLWRALCYSSDRTQFLHAEGGRPRSSRLTSSRRTPLYLQLRDAVIARIARRRAAPGDALPSVRSLRRGSGHQPAHRQTKAYATLRDEGYVIMLGPARRLRSGRPRRPRRRHGHARARGRRLPSSPRSSRRRAARAPRFSPPQRAPRATWTRASHVTRPYSAGHKPHRWHSSPSSPAVSSPQRPGSPVGARPSP